MSVCVVCMRVCLSVREHIPGTTVRRSPIAVAQAIACDVALHRPLPVYGRRHICIIVGHVLVDTVAASDVIASSYAG